MYYVLCATKKPKQQKNRGKRKNQRVFFWKGKLLLV